MIGFGVHPGHTLTPLAEMGIVKWQQLHYYSNFETILILYKLLMLHLDVGGFKCYLFVKSTMFSGLSRPVCSSGVLYIIV